MTALEQEEAQIKGIGHIKYKYGKDDQLSSPKAKQQSYNNNNNNPEPDHNHNLSQQQHQTQQSPAGVSETKAHYAQLKRFITRLPMRLVAIHICFINPEFMDLIKAGLISIGWSSRIRMRFHHGALVTIRFIGNSIVHLPILTCDLCLSFAFLWIYVYYQSLFR